MGTAITAAQPRATPSQFPDCHRSKSRKKKKKTKQLFSPVWCWGGVGRGFSAAWKRHREGEHAANPNWTSTQGWGVSAREQPLASKVRLGPRGNCHHAPIKTSLAPSPRAFPVVSYHCQWHKNSGAMELPLPSSLS